MNKIKEYMATFFGVVFVMSMVGATGAIEADNYLIGFVMALVGISTGILTLILQSEREDYKLSDKDKPHLHAANCNLNHTQQQRARDASRDNALRLVPP